MGAITNIFQNFSDQYLKAFPQMPHQHRKAISSIVNCRSEESGVIIYRCKDCGMEHKAYRSCGNRHCPQCQYHKAQQWLGKQLARQLPTHYFMLTFTVPAELRSFIRGNQKVAYKALFTSSAEAMKLLATDKRFIGADLSGFTGILHTWGRQLQYHPHIHYIVPGGGVDKKNNCWKSSAINFFVPVRALSRVYRAKFRDQIKERGLLNLIAPEVWLKEWNVNSQPVGSAEASLKYLTPYVFRVAISDSRIISVKERVVTLSYRVKKSNRARTMQLDVDEFMRRYLQHVLPTGFMKVRHFGFMSPNCTFSIASLRKLILVKTAELISGLQCMLDNKPKSIKAHVCPLCEGVLVYVASIIPMRPPKPPG